MTARSIPFLVAAALLAFAPATVAQVRIVGAITGTVVDTAGLAVPGARVQLKDEGTGIPKETGTNNDGAFVFPDLNFGSYEVSVSLQGFQTARITQVVVESSRTTDLRVTMHPGGLDEVVEVTGATPVLETTSNVISGTLNNTQLKELPLGGDGRNVFQLARLVPGVAQPAGTGSTHYNGMPGGTINPTIDGINNASNGFKSGGTSFFGTVPARLGAIEEVVVESAGLGADAGAQGGVNLKFITRRGTSKYRGSAFEQHRNEALNANTYFNNSRGIAKPKFRRHDYGGNLGGPLLPNTSLKDKIFFVNFEQEYIPGTMLQTNTVLTSEAEQGIFRYQTATGEQRTANLLQIAAQNGFASTMDPTGRLTRVQTGRVFDPATGEYSPTTYRENWTSSKMGGLFVQDAWRMHQNFTLNYGLRWEFSGAPYSHTGAVHFPDSASLLGPSTALFQPGVLNGVMQPTLTRGSNPASTDYVNPAPNAGFAWTPNFERGLLAKIFGKGAESVIRGGYALVYYDEGTLMFSATAGDNPGQSQSFDLQPGFPGFTPGGLTLQSQLPSSVVFPRQYSDVFNQADFTFGNTSFATMKDDLRTPYVQSWNIGVQRELMKNTVLEARYLGNKASRVWRTYNLNEVNIFENGFTNGGFITALQQGTAGSLANTLATNLGYDAPGPYPMNVFVANPFAVGGANPLELVDDASYSNYHAMQLQLRRRYAGGLTASVNYTLAKNTGDIWAENATQTLNYRTLRDKSLDKGPSPFDVRHAVQVFGTYELPFGKERRVAIGNPVLDAIAGGWVLGGILTAQSDARRIR